MLRFPGLRIRFNRKYLRGPHRISFKHAWDGIKFAFRTQPNFRFHIFAFITAMSAAVWFRVSLVEYLAIILVSGLVFSLEMLNTALEALGDEVAGGRYADLIRVAKDVAAGGVLLAALTSVIVGLVIFLPYTF